MERSLLNARDVLAVCTVGDYSENTKERMESMIEKTD